MSGETPDLMLNDCRKRNLILRKVLIDAANQCDEWAEQSRKGGWSTHQVEANTKLANELRRYAVSPIEALTAPAPEGLAEALREVMEWIENWDVPFLDDPEWDSTAEKVTRALAAQGDGK